MSARASVDIDVCDLKIGNDRPMALFGGMNVLESRDMAMQVAEAYVAATTKLGIPYILKPLSTRPIVPLWTLLGGRA